MKIEQAKAAIMAATLDSLGSMAASEEIDGAEVGAHGLAVASVAAATAKAAWMAGFAGCVGNDPAQAAEAWAVAHTLGAVYRAHAYSAADRSAAALLASRLVAEWDRADPLQLQTARAAWVFGPAGVAIDAGGWSRNPYGEIEPEVWTASWGEILAHLAEGEGDAGWEMEDEEAEGDE